MEDKSMIVCRCEEVTRDDVIKAIANGCHSVSAVKKATRAGMGACQGRTCSRLIRSILIEEGIIESDSTDTDKSRFPVVPFGISSL